MTTSNEITLVGNITRDPELRFTNGGRAVASFGVAVNRRYQVNGEWQEQVSFFNVTAWAELGENAAQSLARGDRVIVTGRMEQQTYTDKEGNERTTFQVVADEIGAGLRFATLEITKVERQQTDGGTSKAKKERPPKAERHAGDEEEPF